MMGWGAVRVTGVNAFCHAQSAQKNSVIARKANTQAREELKMSMRDWKLFKADVLAEADMSSIDVLKVLMHKALLAEDYDTAADLAKSLAEFESPKLARIDQTTTELSVEELTDEELDRKLTELALR